MRRLSVLASFSLKFVEESRDCVQSMSCNRMTPVLFRFGLFQNAIFVSKSLTFRQHSLRSNAKLKLNLSQYGANFTFIR